jgi:hypothetical protein
MINLKNYKTNLIIFTAVAFSASLGFYMTSGSKASTPYAIADASNGNLSGAAVLQTDSSAATGKSVEFGSSNGNSGTSTISLNPIGPTAPSGGWSVAYADDFNDPLGTGSGEDNTWWLGPTLSRGSNPTYDLSSDSSSQANVVDGNLLVTAKYSATPYQAASGSDPATNYLSDQIDTTTGESGYRGFDWYPNTPGTTWVFQINTEWPVNTNDLFNSFWSYAEYSTGSADERDFFEGRPWNGTPEQYWIDSNSLSPVDDFCYSSNSPTCEGAYGAAQSFDPSAAYHTYTYEVFPGGSWSFYIDGQLQPWAANQPSSGQQVDGKPMMLLLDYVVMGGDNQNKTDPGFTSGTRSMKINNLVVYEDKDAKGAGVVGGGLAPGTTINSGN